MESKSLKKIQILLVVSVLLGLGGPVAADDWPQFLGPNRDGISAEKGLLDTWGKNGPPVKWEKEIGEGFSGPVVAEGKLVLFHRKGDKEIVQCYAADTGKELWQQSYGTEYMDALGKGNGPRSTPVIAGGRVYTLGAEGWLHCFELKGGKKVWGRNLLKEYNVPSSYFGIGTTPLVDGKRILVNVGDKKAGIVALDVDNGKEVWRATTDGASYASPVLAKLNGKNRAVFFTRYGVAVLNPESGDVVYHQKWRARYDASVNAATPLVIGDLLFFSTCYETGALLLKASGDKFQEVWSNDESMSNHYNTCIHANGYLYGIHGRQESVPTLRCVELKTGKVMWSREKFGCASMILTGGNIIALTEAGALVSFKAAPEKYQELARAQISNNPPCRAEIALANGLLYTRDQGRLICWNLKKD